jgi:hypothetical protein
MFGYRVSLFDKTKTSRPQWDGRKDSRGTTQISRRFGRTLELTNISLSYNVEITFQTICGAGWHPALCSPEQLERELQLISVECNFQRFCCTSLAASASLLSSVTAFI